MADEKKKRGPIIVETGSDDPSTVSPIIEGEMVPEEKPEPPMYVNPMGDTNGQPDTAVESEPEPGAFAYGADKPTKFVAPFPVAEESATPEAPAAPVATPAPAPVNIGNVTTTERLKLSDEAKEGQAEQLKAAKTNEGIAKREGAAGVDKAKAVADLAANEEREREIARREEMEGRARNQARYEAGLRERDRILADAEKESHRDYWDDKPAGAHLLAAFSSAAGQYAAMMTGGTNGAQEIIDKNMARDDARKERILKQAVYRAGLKGQDAKEAYDNGLMEIQLRKAAVLDKLADHRASVLASKGFDEAQIAQDKLINAAVDTSAKLKTSFGDMLNVKIHSSNELKERYKMESALEDQKLRAAAGKENGRGITDARQRAQLATGIKDQLGVAKRLQAQGVKLSEDDLKTFQDNKTYLDAARRGDKNTMSALETVLSRKIGFIPRSEFDGIDDPKKAELLGALNQVSQKAALLNAGAMTEEAIRHARDMNDLLTPGLGKEERARRWDYMHSDLAGVNAGLVPGELAKAQAGMNAARSEGSTKKEPAPMSKEDRARLTAWLNKNGDDPRAAGVRAALGR